MKVYVVESGEYSDRHIEFITEDEQVAKDFCDIHNTGDYDDYYYSCYDTEEVTIKCIEEERKKRIPFWKVIFEKDALNGWIISNMFFNVTFDKDNASFETYEYDSNPYKSYENKANNIVVYVLYCEHSEKDKAIKIARDKVMQFIAEKEGL